MSADEWRAKKGPLSSQDRFLWEKVCRTTRPLHKKNSSSLANDTVNVVKDVVKVYNKEKHVTTIPQLFQTNQQRLTEIKRENKATTQTHKIHFFDHVVHRKIAKGHYSIEARLDLHGCMQEEAYFFLKEFLQSSQQNGLRYVLVITGKGRSRGSDGVLYHFVPHWLSTPAFRYYVHAFEQAARQHGGDGALYVRLRRFLSKKGYDVI
ncbi:Smr/MutS family protein [Bartonella senegalensis]|uniref:Smr/MutS family protein n=1 Tax=Bartonella senegalensis TaxID=1468418 RepID=UPI0002F9F308|nr:Smr/MutS family protein [Bartonella senegalensis]